MYANFVPKICNTLYISYIVVQSHKFKLVQGLWKLASLNKNDECKQVLPFHQEHLSLQATEVYVLHQPGTLLLTIQPILQFISRGKRASPHQNPKGSKKRKLISLNTFIIPAPAMTTFKGFAGRGALRKDADKLAASKKLTVFSSSGLGISTQTT